MMENKLTLDEVIERGQLEIIARLYSEAAYSLSIHYQIQLGVVLLENAFMNLGNCDEKENKS